MTRARFSVVPSAYLFLLRSIEEAGGPAEQVLLQRRQGAGYMDHWWACGAAGHVEAGESVLAAAVREGAEELGIQIDPEDLEPAATVHRTTASREPIEQRMDFFFAVRRWQGDPHIAEPDKASDLQWWPVDQPPEHLVPHEAQALRALQSPHGPQVLTRGFDQRLTLVAAVGANGVIGDGSAMPWHLPEDLRHFKRLTMGGVLLMGRKTFDSIGSALPGRRTVVITRDDTWAADGVQVAHSLAEALLIAGDGELFVVGGGEVYRQTIDLAHTLVLTEVAQSPPGSVTFPAIDRARWSELSREQHEGFAISRWSAVAPAVPSVT